MSLLIFCASVAFAQLKVMPDGKVGIGITGTPVSKLAVGHVGHNSFVRNYFESDQNTRHVYSTGNQPQNTTM